MTDKRRTWGQYPTPPDVADLLLGFCLRRSTDRLLDPGCGVGILLQRARQWQGRQAASPTDASLGDLWGVELDGEAAAEARATTPWATILNANFFTLDPQATGLFDAIVGNPPYTRAEWIGRLEPASPQQPALFDGLAPAAGDPGDDRIPLLPPQLAGALNRRAGLYAYFFLNSPAFLRENGRLGFVVPNSWLDVDYGRQLKQFLLDHFCVIAIIESSVERWFDQASVNTCLAILERCSDEARRAANRVRFVRLHQSLGRLIDAGPDSSQRVPAVEQLVGRLLPPADRQTTTATVRVVGQGDLDAHTTWGRYLRAPLPGKPGSAENAPPLKSWAAVQRGYTTGANGYFYLRPQTVVERGIEQAYRRPLLKSLRHVHRLRFALDVADRELLLIPPDADLRNATVAGYLAWGVEQTIDRRRSCAGRRPWYALSPQPPAVLLLPKGIWQRHFAPLPDEPIAIDQQIYGLHPAPGVSPLAAAALLNSAWFALQCELRGRANLGDGVLWLAAYEIGDIPLPDPRTLSDESVEQLGRAFNRLSARPIRETAADLDEPDRRALDDLVFSLLGFGPEAADALREALLDRLATRRRRARSNPVGRAVA